MQPNSSIKTVLFIFGFLTLATANPVLINADLIAFYNFEGNANDVTGNGNDGMVNGATLSVDGYEGMGYDFDGVNDSIDIMLDINPTSFASLTMGAWVNARSLGQRVIISNDNGGFDRTLTLDDRGTGSGDRFSAFTGSGVVSAGSDPAILNEWVFVAARYSQVSSQLVLDVDDDRQTVMTSLGNGNSTLQIGRNPGFADVFDGTIDNVFFFDEVLSDARIDQIRAGGAAAITGVPEPSLAITCFVFGAACCLVRKRSKQIWQ
ncbi:MAG: LamG-like jellyroll fold domain-containing protein [Planctomycetota bacterium]